MRTGACRSEPVLVNLLKSPGIDYQPGGVDYQPGGIDFWAPYKSGLRCQPQRNKSNIKAVISKTVDTKIFFFKCKMFFLQFEPIHDGYVGLQYFYFYL
jgi:hypothetical protein